MDVSKEEISDFEESLKASPKVWPAIKTGGCRKARIEIAGKGKKNFNGGGHKDLKRTADSYKNKE